MKIWPWSRIAALEAQLDDAVEYICYLEDGLELDRQQTDLLRGVFGTSSDTFPASSIGEA